MIYTGISSHPFNSNVVYSTDVIDQVITMINQKGLNLYRLSFDENQDATPFVQYFLEHCNHDLILDYYHGVGGYPQGDFTEAQWLDTTNKALNYMEKFKDYTSRLWIEPLNERTNSDLKNRLNTFISTVRDAGYRNKIVVNSVRLDPTTYLPSSEAWTELDLTDPLNRTYVGYHYYFNTMSVSNATSHMQIALDKGFKIVNTEVGANWNEGLYFDAVNVRRITDFMAWCYKKGIGNAVWMRFGLQNWPSYHFFGLKFPR